MTGMGVAVSGARLHLFQDVESEDLSIFTFMVIQKKDIGNIETRAGAQ